jgi:SAM-dependent methyltransferase
LHYPVLRSISQVPAARSSPPTDPTASVFTMPPANMPSRLRETFNAPFLTHAARWNDLYVDSFHPWDRAGPSLALADLVRQRPDLVPPSQEHDSRGNPLRDTTGAVCKLTALVPGCGRGHDALLLAAHGYDVWGLDSSEAGVDLARKNQEASRNSPVYTPFDDRESGSVNWVVGDFFADEWTKGAGADASGKFDLIFDYTVSRSGPLLFFALLLFCPSRALTATWLTDKCIVPLCATARCAPPMGQANDGASHAQGPPRLPRVPMWETTDRGRPALGCLARDVRGLAQQPRRRHLLQRRWHRHRQAQPEAKGRRPAPLEPNKTDANAQGWDE